jgi:hypothetical protein
MARRIYSTQFIATTLADGEIAEFTGEDDQIMDIRCVDAYLLNAGFGQPVGKLTITLDDLTIKQWAFPPTWAGTVQWRGRQLGRAATTLQAVAAGIGAVCEVSVSGYLFQS